MACHTGRFIAYDRIPATMLDIPKQGRVLNVIINAGMAALPRWRAMAMASTGRPHARQLAGQYRPRLWYAHNQTVDRHAMQLIYASACHDTPADFHAEAERIMAGDYPAARAMTRRPDKRENIKEKACHAMARRVARVAGRIEHVTFEDFNDDD